MAGGFSFPSDDNAPVFIDNPLGPVDRLRGWLGWTIEDNPLRSDARRTLRMENGTLLYGDNSPSATVEDFPFVTDNTGHGHSIWDAGASIWDNDQSWWDQW